MWARWSCRKTLSEPTAPSCKPERGRCRVAAAVRVGVHRAGGRGSEINVTRISRTQQLLEELGVALSQEATSAHHQHVGRALERLLLVQGQTEHSLLLLGCGGRGAHWQLRAPEAGASLTPPPCRPQLEDCALSQQACGQEGSLVLLR